SKLCESLLQVFGINLPIYDMIDDPVAINKHGKRDALSSIPLEDLTVLIEQYRHTPFIRLNELVHFIHSSGLKICQIHRDEFYLLTVFLMELPQCRGFIDARRTP